LRDRKSFVANGSAVPVELVDVTGMPPDRPGDQDRSSSS
jgi:hypothetical protein